MDTVLKIARRHFNYNCKGGFSCTCPGCAGPVRTRIAEMVTYIDQDQDRNRSDQRSRQKARRVSRDKKLLMRRAKRKESRFAMREACEQQ